MAWRKRLDLITGRCSLGGFVLSELSKMSPELTELTSEFRNSCGRIINSDLQASSDYYGKKLLYKDFAGL